MLHLALLISDVFIFQFPLTMKIILSSVIPVKCSLHLFDS